MSPRIAARLMKRLRAVSGYLVLPVGLVVLLSLTSFRSSVTYHGGTRVLGNPLQLPHGWALPNVPDDNPITPEKFLLGKYLFFEPLLSGDRQTSCGTCHNPRVSFSSRGLHAGAFNTSSHPLRTVPRLVNVAYDSVLTWDGKFHSLEAQVKVALVKKGDLQADTATVFQNLSQRANYRMMFVNAFGDSVVTVDRIAKAIATFERCLISGNSAYDRYVQGDLTALSPSAIRGMKLFFDTTKTNCASCHNSNGSLDPMTPGQLFTDNNYYRTGTFEGKGARYGLDPTQDTLHLFDGGRAEVTRDSNDIGKFRTPTLRNLALTPPYGAAGSVQTISAVLNNYNHGGTVTSSVDSEVLRVFNQDPRIRPLALDSLQLLDIAAFLSSLTDESFISNPDFQDPSGFRLVSDPVVAGDLHVFPNPSSNFVNIECPELKGNVDATLVDERGVVVWRSSLQVDGKCRLDFGDVPAGAYRLDLLQGNPQGNPQGNLRRSVPLVLSH